VEDRPRRVNDSSQVVLVSAAGRGVLLCGDIELEALTLLRQREPQLRADVVELPHHGSWREESLQFVLERRPLVAIQSTGRRRALDPRWSCSLQGVQHFVTARDGAIHVEISADGAVDVWTHR
jgi:competence protein ComEC